MINAGSRYANSTTVPGTNLAGNDIMVILFTPPTDTSFQFTYYQVTAADFIDVLAYKFYSDPTLWWVIANANPEILDWSTLTPGYLLRIPSVSPVA